MWSALFVVVFFWDIVFDTIQYVSQSSGTVCFMYDYASVGYGDGTGEDASAIAAEGESAA